MSCGCVLAGTGTSNDDHGDGRNITRTRVRLAADAAEIGTVAAARNILSSLGASEMDDFDIAKSAWTEVLKAEPERRYTLLLAWPALKPDVAKAADGRRDYARPEVIEETAWAWMLKSRTVGLYHADGTEGRGDVVESYVYRGPDWQARPDTLIKAGDWLVGVVWDRPAWALWKAGLLNGASPQGSAKRAAADPNLIFDRS